MKKVLFFIAAAFIATSAYAQSGTIISNSPEGADPAVISIEFLPVDAVVFPNGDVQIGVALKGTVRNIGTQPYMPVAPEKLNVVVYQLIKGEFVPVKKMGLFLLGAGASATIQYGTTYIQGNEPAPTFIVEVQSKNAGVPHPDVNMNNNKKKQQAPN